MARKSIDVAAGALEQLAGSATAAHAAAIMVMPQWFNLAERAVDQLQRAVDLAEAVAQRHEWIEMVPDDEPDGDPDAD